MASIDKIEYSRRLFEIQGWIIEGWPAGMIIRQIIANEWTEAKTLDNQERSARRMLAAARDNWVEDMEVNINKQRKIRIAKLEQMQRGMKAEFRCTPQGLSALARIEKLIIDIEGSKFESSLKMKEDNPDVDLSKLPIVFK